MTTDDNIRDVKWQYDINTEAAKISVLSSGKINRHEYSTGEETLPSIQKKKIVEKAKFTYSPLGESFRKTDKKNW